MVDRLIAPIGASLLALISFFVVLVAPTSGAEYPEAPVQQAEQICRAFGQKLPTLGPRGRAKTVPPSEWTQAELRHKGRALRETGRALRKTAVELDAIEFLPEYRDQFAEWIGFLKGAASRYKRAGATLAAGNKKEGLHLMHHLELPSRLQAFEEAVGFRYCRLEPEQLAHETVAIAR